MIHRPKLRLIKCGNQNETLLGLIQVVAAPKNSPPFKVEAIAAEEDTFQVLSADPVVHETFDHPVRLMTQVIETRPELPGSILVKGKNPLRLLAIIHDLNLEPSWKEEWIASALERIFRESEKRRLRSLGLPLLGTLHGSLDHKRFIVLLQKALEQISPTNLKRLWLIVAAGTSRSIIDMLK